MIDIHFPCSAIIMLPPHLSPCSGTTQLAPGVTAIAVQVVLSGGTLSQNWGLLALQMAIFGPLAATQPVVGFALFPPEVSSVWNRSMVATRCIT